MSDYNFDNKPKSDYVSAPERGGCLTAFLVVVGFASVVLVLFMVVALGSLSQIPDSQRDTVQTGAFLQIIISGFALACVYGLWNWKRWAYYGFFAIYGLNMLISLFSLQYLAVGGAAIGMGILFYLMNDKVQYLE